MMGAHHAATGAAAWVALTTQFSVPLNFITQPMGWGEQSVSLGLGLLDVGPAGVLTGALITAGAALVPDADHHNATIAHSLPPLSNIACAGIGQLSGGHRHGTHSIIGIAAFVFVAWAAGLWTVETELFGTVTPLAGLLCVFLVAFAAKALKFIPDRMRKVPWAVGITVAALVTVFAPDQQNWFPLAMGIGVIVHILGDMMTTGGCNLVWPFTIKPPKALQGVPVLKRIWQKNGYVSFPVLGNAGSFREWLMLIPISLYVVIAMGASTIDLGQETLIAIAEGL